MAGWAKFEDEAIKDHAASNRSAGECAVFLSRTRNAVLSRSGKIGVKFSSVGVKLRSVGGKFLSASPTDVRVLTRRWTNDEDDLVRQCAKDGKSTVECARIVTAAGVATSSRAVQTRAAKLGVSFSGYRTGKANPAAEFFTEKKIIENKKQPSAAPPPAGTVPWFKDRHEIVPEDIRDRGHTIVTVSFFGMCKFPYGIPGSFFLCGDPTLSDGAPYCGKHARACYNRP